MRALVQRCSQAAVDVEGTRVAQIKAGMVVLLGVKAGDTEAECDRLAEKVLALRVFELLVHAHDLRGQSWDSDEAETLAGWVLENGRDVVELMRTFGVLAPARSVGPDADACAGLLAVAGRDPG